MKIIFTQNIFQILLFKGRPVLGITQHAPGNERVKFSVKNQNTAQLLLELLVGTTSVNSICLYIIRKLMKYVLQKFFGKKSCPYLFWDTAVQSKVNIRTWTAGSREQNGYVFIKKSMLFNNSWNCLKIHCRTSVENVFSGF